MRLLALAHEVATYGGMQNYVGAFIDAARKDHEVSVLTRDAVPRPGESRTRFTRREFALVQQGMKAGCANVDLVIADQVQTAAVSAFTPRRYLRASFIHAAELTGGRWMSAKRATLAAQDRLWGPSQWICDFVVENYSVDASVPRVLSPGVDIDLFLPASADLREEMRIARGLSPDRPLIISAARLTSVASYKGIDLTIQACRVLGDIDPQLIVVGAGDDLARLRSLSDGVDVTFLGRIETRDLAACMAISDVFSMPSHAAGFGHGVRTEGFGIVFLEAAAAGIPSVRGTAPGTAEAIIEGRTGSSAEPNPEAVAAAIRPWLELDPRARAGVAQDCRAWAAAHSRARFGELVTKEIQLLAASRGRAA
jgi:glycosyltransferase involved in cell wall biosynthesis